MSAEATACTWVPGRTRTGCSRTGRRTIRATEVATGVWVRVLGSAAGGGFPQWNCACPACRAVRDGSRPARPRTQSSIAVSPDYRRWFLFNASPDIRAQIESFPASATLQRPPRREGRSRCKPCCSPTPNSITRSACCCCGRDGASSSTPPRRCATRFGTGRRCSGRSRPTARSSGGRSCRGPTPAGGGLSYQAFDVPTTKRPRFGPADGKGRVVGYRLTDERTGRTLVYLPSCRS